MGEFAIPWGTPTGEFAVITVSLILTLLLGGVGWTPEVLLSWGEMLLVKAWGAPSWISTPVGKLRDVISPLLSVGDERSRGASRLLSFVRCWAPAWLYSFEDIVEACHWSVDLG